jgi:hypothetical protein
MGRRETQPKSSRELRGEAASSAALSGGGLVRHLLAPDVAEFERRKDLADLDVVSFGATLVRRLPAAGRAARLRMVTRVKSQRAMSAADEGVAWRPAPTFSAGLQQP